MLAPVIDVAMVHSRPPDGKETRQDRTPAPTLPLERRPSGSSPGAVDVTRSREAPGQGATHDQAARRRRCDPRRGPAALSRPVSRSPAGRSNETWQPFGVTVEDTASSESASRTSMGWRRKCSSRTCRWVRGSGAQWRTMTCRVRLAEHAPVRRAALRRCARRRGVQDRRGQHAAVLRRERDAGGAEGAGGGALTARRPGDQSTSSRATPRRSISNSRPWIGGRLGNQRTPWMAAAPAGRRISSTRKLSIGWAA
jgi:hypothetical protein